MLLLRNFLSVVAGVLFTLGWYFGWKWILGSCVGLLMVFAFIPASCLTTLISTRYDLLHALIAASVAALVLVLAGHLPYLNPAKSNVLLIILRIFLFTISTYSGFFLGFMIKRKKPLS